MTDPLKQARPLAWLCELMQEDGSVRQQIVTENPDGIRWNDSGEPSPFKVTPLYAAIDAQAATVGATSAHFSPVTVLPDGSAFATASFPLPKDHWLYAPRGEWDDRRDEYAECPAPILTHAHRDAVQAAVRYAVRGATMCGQDADFDPDALVLNAIYALCGPFGRATPPAVQAPAPLTDAWRKLYKRAINEANGLTNYVDDRPELRRAERNLTAIEAEARSLDAAMAAGAAAQGGE